MVELTVLDRSVQRVLDCLDAERPAFGQGTLVDFRSRLIANDLDRRLLARSAEVARARGGFDPRKLPKWRRIAVDARPVRGAGRVEDMYNLLGHATRNVARCAAELLTDEKMQQRFRKLQKTSAGRRRLLERTGVEHRLAHVARRQAGPPGALSGQRKNLFDLRRLSTVQSLETWHRSVAA
jgi:hypothetical protein